MKGKQLSRNFGLIKARMSEKLNSMILHALLFLPTIVCVETETRCHRDAIACKVLHRYRLDLNEEIDFVKLCTIVIL